MICDNTKQFTLCGNDFVAEQSDLGPVIRMFDLESHKTSKRSTWEHVTVIRDIEGELQARIYGPTPSTLNRHPQLRDYRVVILND